MTTDPVLEEAAQLLVNDLVATLGIPVGSAALRARRAVKSAAGQLADREDGDPLQLAFAASESLQQWLHDTFIDVSWPSCPVHGRHPLWLDETQTPHWRCPSTNEAVAALGSLASVLTAPAPSTVSEYAARLAAEDASQKRMEELFSCQHRPKTDPLPPVEN